MLFKLSTDKTVSGTAAAVQAAVEANHFGVMQVHNLKETMTKKGVEFRSGMSDLRGLSAATSQEAARTKHERLHRAAVPNLHLRGGRQNHSGHRSRLGWELQASRHPGRGSRVRIADADDMTGEPL